MTNTEKLIYFLSKNGKRMKKVFDKQIGKSKTVFVSKEEIKNIH